MLAQIVECLGTFYLRATEGQLRRLPMATLAAKSCMVLISTRNLGMNGLTHVFKRHVGCFVSTVIRRVSIQTLIEFDCLFGLAHQHGTPPNL